MAAQETQNLVIGLPGQSAPSLLGETEKWVVLNKPAGWLSIPAGQNQLNVFDWACQSFGALLVVHRLDRETSGVILFAKTAEAHREANIWFQDRKVKKTYVCLAKGRSLMPVVKINSPIQGMPSVTQVEIEKQWKNAFLAQVRPLTGRRHQIRIHLSSKGHPILGDTQYGGPKEFQIGNRFLNVSRVALHAKSLELPTAERFEAPIPEDMKSWIGSLEQESDS